MSKRRVVACLGLWARVVLRRTVNGYQRFDSLNESRLQIVIRWC